MREKPGNSIASNNKKEQKETVMLSRQAYPLNESTRYIYRESIENIRRIFNF